LVRLLESADDLVVVGEADDGESALALADSRTSDPDVLLIDVPLPGIDGLETTRRLTEAHSDVDVVIFTAFNEPRWIAEAVRAGAKGYILKTASGEEILSAVRMVVDGHMVFDSSIASVLDTRAVRELPEGHGPQLSSREHDVLSLASKGFTNAEIAAELGISVQTVKTHMERVFKRLDAVSRGEAIATALRMGILE
jgi:DNA-binding NarL/FixJ family response regulator